MVYPIDTHSINVGDDICASNTSLEIWILDEGIEVVNGRNEMDALISFHFGDTTVWSFLGYRAISNVLQIFKECRLWYFATSALKGSVLEQTEFGRKTQEFNTLKGLNLLHQLASFS